MSRSGSAHSLLVCLVLLTVARATPAAPRVIIGGNVLGEPLLAEFPILVGGSSSFEFLIGSGAPLTAVGAGDANGDGRDELYWGDAGLLGAYACALSVGSSGILDCGPGPVNDIGFADTDGDGADEFLALFNQPDCAVLGVRSGIGAGNLTTICGNTLCSNGGFLVGAGFADITGDGTPDIVGACSGGSTGSYLSLNGSLFSSPCVGSPTNEPIVDVTAADLDENGWGEALVLYRDFTAELCSAGPLSPNVRTSYSLFGVENLSAASIAIAFDETCTTDADCLDADACNGIERCVASRCVRGPSLNCLRGGQVCQTDSDGDGLLDVWETSGINIDCDAGGSIEIDLPTMGVDPLHKDVLLEIDYTQHGSEPSQAMVRAMKAALRAAPLYAGGVNNADNLPGINLFVDTGDLTDPLGLEPGPNAGQCDDRVDNDGDGLADGLDPDCTSNYGLEGVGPCDDMIDNDGDGLIDGLAPPAGPDPDCVGREFLSTGSCTDGVDNNGDGLIDNLAPPLGPDPGCANPAARYVEGAGYCSDTVDDDGDGSTDLADDDCLVGSKSGRGRGGRVPIENYPRGGINGNTGADGFYTIAQANFDRASLGILFKYAVVGLSFNNTIDEAGATALEGGSMDARSCEDFIDNDGNGLTDIEDPPCQVCFDGVDNDGDGDIDGADSNCVYRDKGGQAEVPGNDLAVFNTPPANLFLPRAGGLRGSDPGSFLHELGHTLGLRHGGFEEHNCKPNYASVMNYLYQGGLLQKAVPGLPGQRQDVDRNGVLDAVVIDFWPPRNTSFLGRSDILSSLVENQLDETQAIDRNDPDNTMFFVNLAGNRRLGVPLIGEDTDGDGDIDGTDWTGDGTVDNMNRVAVNIDTSDQSGWPASCTNAGPPAGPALPLEASSDWRALVLNQGSFSDSDSDAINPSTESTSARSSHEVPESIRAALEADLSIAITGPANAAGGTQIQLTLVVENQSGNSAYETRTRLALPKDTTFLASSGNCGQYVPDFVDCYLGGVRASDVLVFTVDIRLGDLAASQCDLPGVTATVRHGGDDPDLTNNEASFAAGGLDGGPWPMRSRCPRHQARSPHEGPTLGNLLWAFPTRDHVRSSPVVARSGSIYFGSADGKLRALNPDGSLLWAFRTLGSVDSTPAIGSNGSVYVGSDDNHLYSVDAATGALRWKFRTHGAVDSSPVVSDDGTIYVGSDDHHLYAVNPDGSQRWSFRTHGDVDSSPALGADGTIYVGSDDDKLYAINKDGTRKWDFRTYGDIDSSPAVGLDGTIYVGSDDRKLYAVNPDGTLRWAFRAHGDIDSSPAVGADGTVYFGSDRNKVYAVRPDSGQLVWSFDTRGDVNSSPAIDRTGIVYVGADDGKLYALRPEPGLADSARVVFRVDLERAVLSSPAVGLGGVLYVGSDAGKLFAIGDSGETAPEPGCTLTTWNGHNYWFCRHGRDWGAAQGKCQAVGTDLVAIESQAEDSFLREAVGEDSRVEDHHRDRKGGHGRLEDLWAGGSDRAQEGKWIWSSPGSQFWQGDWRGRAVGGSYSNWSRREPDDLRNEDCLSVGGESGKWDDESCSKAFAYVCESAVQVLASELTDDPDANAKGAARASDHGCSVAWPSGGSRSPFIPVGALLLACVTLARVIRTGRRRREFRDS